jgi:flagellar hook-associated protein 3 FlgL
LIRQKLDSLVAQASSGRAADSYAGLGAGAAVSLNLNPQIASLQTWQSNIDAAAGRLDASQAALTRMQQIASDFNATLNNLNGLNPSEVDNAAASARQALVEVAGLLNTQSGGVYVFAGQDSANPPVPDPDNILTSGFFTQIASAVAGLSGAGAAATASATLGIAASNAAGTTPFSAYLSLPPGSQALPKVQVGQNRTVATGLLANANAIAVSGGSSTTGSSVRDLMRALATIGSLTPAQVNDPGFGALVQDTRISLTGAIQAMATDAGALGDTQSNLTATKTELGQVQTVLTSQVSSVQDADMAATLSNISAVQTQLQASYQLIGLLKGLSLANFLSGS